MEKFRAIPEGYMTVGELAKKMKTTKRTLQYYDNEGLLSPSSLSVGGRRLYDDKDVVKLHQIQSLKYLGFSLDEIKNKLISLDNPADVAQVLQSQATSLQLQIDSLVEIKKAVELLATEVLQMKKVDFRKYADIVTLLRLGNEEYWVLKHFDEKVFERITEHFDEDSGVAFVEKWKDLCAKSSQLKKENVPSDSVEGKAIGKAWWDMIIEFTGGDMSMLPQLMEFNDNRKNWHEDLKQPWENAQSFVQGALAAYFADLGYNPLMEVQNDSNDKNR